jgi:hypothetical protein
VDIYEKRFGSWDTAKGEAIRYQNGSASSLPKDPSLELLKRQNSHLLAELEQERDRTSLIVDALECACAKLNIRPVAPAKKVKSKLEQEFHALRSDEQVGMVVDPRTTQNLGKYDFDTYKKYLSRWLEKVLMFKEQDHESLGLNKLVIARLGDHVEGEAIYKGQAFYIDRPVVDQIFGSLELEVGVIQTLAQEFHEIEIMTVSGNHGRIAKKGEHHTRTNWDYFLNRMLKISLQCQPNVKVFVSDDPVMIVEHGKFLFAYKHGSNIKSWMGLPFYGIERDFSRLPHLYGKVINYECIGHHHQPANIKDSMLVNGSFPGPTDLSVNQMTQGTRPSQKIFYFDPNHGINRETNVYLADPVELVGDINGIYTAYQ